MVKDLYQMPFPERKTEADIFHINIVGIPCVAHLPHIHDYFQIYYVINSHLVHHVENEESCPLSRGDMFIIPPGKMHYVEMQPDSTFYCFSFCLSFLEKDPGHNNLAIEFLHRLQNDSSERIRPKLTIDSEDIFYMETIMAHILKEFTSKRFGYEETIREYTFLLVSMFARSYFEESGGSLPVAVENSKQYVLSCIEYIETNYTEDITLEEICKRSAMSKGSFCSLFMQLTGYSFNTYLNMCRIKKATEYIKKGYNVTGIYGLCGYNNFSTFHRNFKKILGVTPQEYKKAQKTAL